ncbi:MAG: hypothetical protein R3D84_04335 [Paracoccaceae bacterium]
MMSELSVAAMADEVADAIEAQLGIRGKGLQTKLRRAGRLLPRRIRREGALLVENLARGGNPRLMKQVDLARCTAARDACLDHLRGIDTARRRMNRIVGTTASLLFILIAVGGVTVAVLRWRGFL